MSDDSRERAELPEARTAAPKQASVPPSPSSGPRRTGAQGREGWKGRVASFSLGGGRRHQKSARRPGSRTKRRICLCCPSACTGAMPGCGISPHSSVSCSPICFPVCFFFVFNFSKNIVKNREIRTCTGRLHLGGASEEEPPRFCIDLRLETREILKKILERIVRRPPLMIPLSVLPAEDSVVSLYLSLSFFPLSRPVLFGCLFSSLDAFSHQDCPTVIDGRSTNGR